MLTEHAALQNTGVQGINMPGPGSQREPQKTLLILGAPRGGTSALAGALSAMDIFMGQGAAPPVFESLALANAIEAGDLDRVRELVATFDASHDVWAFKRPGFTRFVDEFTHYFRNPIYLVILRDPVATANRSFISGRLKVNYLKKLRRVLTVYSGIVEFIESSGSPALFISYEKLLQDPRATLTQITAELGLDVSERQLELAIDFVEPSPEHYLEVSRSDRVEGAWLKFTDSTITGWARYVNKTMTIPPKVGLYEGSRQLSVVVANEATALPEGDDSSIKDCGFTFDLQPLDIRNRHALRVRVEGEIRDFDAPPHLGEAKRVTWWRRLLSGAEKNV